METIKLRKTRISSVAFMAALAACTPVALGGQWSAPTGAGDHFSYSNGGDLNGYFGDPFFFDDTFYFTGANFHTNVSNGQTMTQFDTVAFDALVNPGFAFASVQLPPLFGSYSVVGSGSYVELAVDLQVRENGGLQRTWLIPAITSPTFPIIDGSGVWWGSGTMVDFTLVDPPAHNDLNVAFSVSLTATAGAEGSAEVNLQWEDGNLTFTFTPEPASATLLALAAAMMPDRRGVRRYRRWTPVRSAGRCSGGGAHGQRRAGRRSAPAGFPRSLPLGGHLSRIRTDATDAPASALCYPC